MLPIHEVVQLNQYAQGVRPIAEASLWFASLNAVQNQDVLRELAALIQQAHPLPAEIAAAASKAGLKPTHTLSVLLSRGTFAVQAARVVALGGAERQKAFLLFVALLGIADGRRRQTDCVGGCSHWWHQDLSNEVEVQNLEHGE